MVMVEPARAVSVHSRSDPRRPHGGPGRSRTRLDEGNIHACPLLGVDLGGVLYFFGMFGWFMLMTIPFGAIGFLVWLGFAAVLLIRRLRRSEPA
jgi:hypothetical protein